MALFAALVFAALLLPGGAEYAISITSDPSTGPFLRGSRSSPITFHCSVEPLPPEPVTYRWRSTDPYIFGDTNGQNRSFYVYFAVQHFSWLFCEVLTNGSSVGNASTFAEYQGYIFTQDTQARCFSVGDAISLGVNKHWQYGHSIRNLTWYHNGTEVESGGRVTVNHTNLTIHSAFPADAGVYQVKITSIDPHGNQNDTCDALWLPILENHAALAPTTFMLSECIGGKIQYDIEKVGGVRSYYIMNDGVEPQIAVNFDTSLVEDPFLTYSTISWHHNGAPVDAGRVVGTASYQPGSISVTLTVHNATAEDTGVYEGTTYIHRNTLSDSSLSACYDYFSFIGYAINIYFFQIVSLSFIVDLYEPPIASVSAGSPSLLARETTLLTCRAEGGNPSTHTLTWSKDSEVLATGTNTLSVSSVANTFGEYVCNVQTVVGPENNKVTDYLEFLLKEKNPMQLQIASGVHCAVWKESTTISDVVLAVQDGIHSLCNCSVDLQNVTLTCSASGSSVIISANLSYSDTRGEVTASDLVASLQTWLLTASQPTITIAGKSYSLSRTCPADSNLEAFVACFNDFSSSSGALAGLFMGGLCAGLILAIVAFGIVICVFLKVRQSIDMDGSQAENKEVNISGNSAYEMTRYQTKQTAVAAEEPVYEVPV